MGGKKSEGTEKSQVGMSLLLSSCEALRMFCFDP